MAVVLASGCCMGRRTWSFEESVRIDSVMARGLEPLDERAAEGMPAPNVPQTPSAPLALSSKSFGSGGPKRVKLGKVKAQSKPKSGKQGSKAKKGSKGFSFSGL